MVSLIDFVLTHLPAPSARVLEVGCGNGELALALDAAGYEVMAIDPAAPDGAIFRRIKLEELEDDARFDAVRVDGRDQGARFPLRRNAARRRIVSTRMTDLERIFGPVAASTRCAAAMRETLEHVVQLAVELAREGREGRKIGTLFVIGDVEAVLDQSQSLLLDPLYGHADELLDVRLPEFRETVKELAQLDGAFVVNKQGTFVSAARYISVDPSTTLLPGLGTRHAAAASITKTTRAVAVVVSQSSIVRVYAEGEIRAEIVPELFLLSRDGLFTEGADVRQVPEAGITYAVSDR